MTLHGSCMCGAIAFTSDYYTAEPVLTALCHCVDCQKWTGSAFTSNVVVPRDTFKVTKGTPKYFDIAGASGKNNRHFFCGTCGSSLYGELDVMGDKTVIKAGTLDNGEASLRNKVDIEFFATKRVAYLTAVDGAKQEPQFG
ncbi:Glutathione-dependent formaldehyde-activating enzyme/centromere protein V [Penicillium griseofulvum]|uniref:Glutathione-dependent formaldehyde-activating enzyme/centromere protein V n=1 Tax=Penicillium patulum TaxID=5078 RepID=A0A135LWL4_PENPA|nr:Glutathione-dependent formaldehyde-activating enzyme/centromere protein V [Penicillium griseofulvum]KXG53329.1 Glutathione-dependent formaldehyde-activating enzyme/centromere protein V [Penicillium griseofulvum]